MDIKKEEELYNLGWREIAIWQCELKNKTTTNGRLANLELEIKQNNI